MAKDNKITLYDLQLAHGATISPFVWATKYAIAHKGFELDIVPGGFTGIPERTGGVTERLPAIVDDGKWVLDSWLIAEYLDETYPDRPTLIPASQRQGADHGAGRLAVGRGDQPVDDLLPQAVSRPLARLRP